MENVISDIVALAGGAGLFALVVLFLARRWLHTLETKPQGLREDLYWSKKMAGVVSALMALLLVGLYAFERWNEQGGLVYACFVAAFTICFVVFFPRIIRRILQHKTKDSEPC